MTKNKSKFKEQLAKIEINESQQSRNLKLLLEKARTRKARKVDEKLAEELKAKREAKTAKEDILASEPILD